MDAKAKVVAWRWCHHDEPDWRVSVQQPVGESEPLIPLTDHEAAMAGLRAAFEDRQGFINIQNQLNADLVVQLEAAVHAKQTLLTGLEALAGEWKKEPAGQYEYDQGHAEGMHDCGNELSYRLAEYRTLTNPANSENNEV